MSVNFARPVTISQAEEVQYVKIPGATVEPVFSAIYRGLVRSRPYGPDILLFAQMAKGQLMLATDEFIRRFPDPCAAARLAQTHVGVIAWSRIGDPDLSVWGPPEVLVRTGVISDEYEPGGGVELGANEQ